MKSSSFDVTIGISVHSLELCNSISEIMGVPPTKHIKKGESQFQFQEKACENIWIYSIKHRNAVDLDFCIEEFMERIPNLGKKVEEINRFGWCNLRISIVSLMAQIGFSLSSYDLQRFSILGIPVNISVFSWGNIDEEVEDNSPT